MARTKDQAKPMGGKAQKAPRGATAAKVVTKSKPLHKEVVEEEELVLEQQEPKKKKRSNGPKEKERRRCVYLRRLLKQVHRMQRGTESLLPKAPLDRLIRQCAGNVGLTTEGYRFRSGAIDALRQAVESFTVDFFTKVNESADIHLRPTALPMDCNLAVSMMNLPPAMATDMKQAIHEAQTTQIQQQTEQGKRCSQLAYCDRVNEIERQKEENEQEPEPRKPRLTPEQVEAYKAKKKAQAAAEAAAVVSPMVVDIEAEEAGSDEEEDDDESVVEEQQVTKTTSSVTSVTVAM